MHADTLDVDVIQPLITEEMVQQQRLCQDPEACTHQISERERTSSEDRSSTVVQIKTI